MRIAIISTIEESVPPHNYGAVEWIVYHLAHELGIRGHEVDVFASGDSRKEKYYNLIQVTPQHLNSIPEFRKNVKMKQTAWLLSIAKIISLLKNKKYDVINNHAGWSFLFFADFVNPKPIMVHHAPLNQQYQRLIYKEHKTIRHIALSNNQRRGFPELNYLATIYNGIDLNYYPKTEEPQTNNLVFLGRISEKKGAIEAVIAAQKLKKHLTIAARVNADDEEYFHKFKGYLDNNYVTFIGEIPHLKTIQFLTNARALIMPVSYEDPCPLVPLETIACGTPVIAYARGALPEQIVDNKTGFLINYSDSDIRGDWIIKKTGIEGLCEAVEKIYSLPEDQYRQMRLNCRKHVEENFTVKRMVNEYEKMFQKICKN